jgi:disulfide bond formation protein DsbB
MLNPLHWSYRAAHAAGLLACVALLAYALHVQFDLHIEPCPLCILQRIAFMALGLLYLLAALQAPRGRGRRVYVALIAIAALAGIAVAARQLWLQSQPPDPFASCGAPLPYLMQTLPLGEVLRKVFTGSGDCAVVNWRFLGLAMPFWSLLCYVVLGSWAVRAASHR